MAFHARHASREVITRYRHDRTGRAGHALLPTDGAQLDHARLFFDGCEELELKTMDLARIDKIAKNVVDQHWTINKQIGSTHIFGLICQIRHTKQGCIHMPRKLAVVAASYVGIMSAEKRYAPAAQGSAKAAHTFIHACLFASLQVVVTPYEPRRHERSWRLPHGEARPAFLVDA